PDHPSGPSTALVGTNIIHPNPTEPQRDSLVFRPTKKAPHPGRPDAAAEEVCLFHRTIERMSPTAAWVNISMDIRKKRIGAAGTSQAPVSRHPEQKKQPRTLKMSS